jgi:Ni/Co efflux regulator RcnB
MRDRDHNRRWYDERSWRRTYHAPKRYRVPSYRYPSGWYVRSWNYGDFLPWGWFTTSYYLNASYYGLPYPPIGCEWIRVGDDAYLVDIWSGRIVSVYYDLFW